MGARENGKIFRAYDKAAQTKCDKYPNWNRFEVQIGNRFSGDSFRCTGQP
ncbi:hypothetical protein QW180_28865 [Vibrio sinaloensis]|nr:hypothetical protein [Vibrio sinaloensis]